MDKKQLVDFAEWLVKNYKPSTIGDTGTIRWHKGSYQNKVAFNTEEVAQEYLQTFLERMASTPYELEELKRRNIILTHIRGSMSQEDYQAWLKQQEEEK